MPTDMLTIIIDKVVAPLQGHTHHQIRTGITPIREHITGITTTLTIAMIIPQETIITITIVVIVLVPIIQEVVEEELVEVVEVELLEEATKKG